MKAWNSMCCPELGVAEKMDSRSQWTASGEEG